MLIVELNMANGRCLDGVYVFFGKQSNRSRGQLEALLREDMFFGAGGKSLSPVAACGGFRMALTKAITSVPDLQLAWTTKEAVALAAERGLTLSDAELWHVRQSATLGLWDLQCYGDRDFPAYPDHNPVWLVDAWLGNLSQIDQDARAGYLQFTPTHVVEVVLSQVQDDELGACWEAYLGAAPRCMPGSAAVTHAFLAADSDARDLETTLVHERERLQAALAEL